MRTSLAVTNGVTLDLKGAEAGGDCDEVGGARKERESGVGGGLGAWLALIHRDTVCHTRTRMTCASTADDFHAICTCGEQLLEKKRLGLFRAGGKGGGGNDKRMIPVKT